MPVPDLALSTLSPVSVSVLTANELTITIAAQPDGNGRYPVQVRGRDWSAATTAASYERTLELARELIHEHAEPPNGASQR
jgi:hypothetical protein